MDDYRQMFDYEGLRSWDIGPVGTEVTVTIDQVTPGTLHTQDEGDKRMPFIKFREFAKPYGCNKTNGVVIAGMFGKKPAKWVGKRITIVIMLVQGKGGGMVDGIRVKPERPDGAEEVAELLAKPSKKVA